MRKKLTSNEKNALALIALTVVFLFIILVKIELDIRKQQNVHQKVEIRNI